MPGIFLYGSGALFPRDSVSHWSKGMLSWLGWLASKLPGSACLCLLTLRFEAHAAMPKLFMWVQEILTEVFKLAKQVLRLAEPAPSSLSSYQYLQKILTSTYRRRHLHPQYQNFKHKLQKVYELRPSSQDRISKHLSYCGHFSVRKGQVWHILILWRVLETVLSYWGRLIRC